MFSKFELTNKGVELLNRVIAESKTLKFTKFQIGKGEFSGNKKTLTQLVSKFDEFNVTEKNVLPNNITNIKGFYDNRNVSVATKFTEIGLMAQLGDDSLTEVLFSYANQPTNEAETIPSKESYFSRTFSVMNRTDNVTSITFDLKIRQDKYNFGTLAEMKAADYLDVGDKVTLWGNAALGDSSFKMYIITDQSQPIQLNNKLYAKEYFKIVNDLTTGGTTNALSGEMGKSLDNKKVNRNGDIFTGLIKMKMASPYIEFLNTSNERMGHIGYGALDRTKLQIINALKSNENVSNVLEIFNDGSLAIPYETIPDNRTVDANDLIPSSDVGTKLYRISSSSVIINSSNFPSGARAGFLRVTKTYNMQITQEYFDTTNNNTYIRYKLSSWSSWVSVDKKHYTVMFAKGTGDSSDTLKTSNNEVALDIFKDRQFGDGYLAQYDSTDKTIKILKSGRYMINMDIYYVVNVSNDSIVWKLYKNGTLIDYTEGRGNDIREKKNINLVYDLNANDKLKLTVRSKYEYTVYVYTPKEYSRLQLTKISEIGGL